MKLSKLCISINNLFIGLCILASHLSFNLPLHLHL